jgi:NAD(P)-dependent dehydrogenase (short-subunit alcohol dehydrogenase family)
MEASPSARVINVSSSQHQGATMNFDDLNGVKSYSGLRAYQQSKLANLLFTYELARRLKGTNITVNAFNPGTIATHLWTDNGFIGRLLLEMHPVPMGNLFPHLGYARISPHQASRLCSSISNL